MTNDGLWRQYVLAYDIDVPQERVEEELGLIRADLKHRMVYEQMGGGGMHLFPDMELREQEKELMEAAIFEAKEPRVLKDLAMRHPVEVSADDLLVEAQAMAARQDTTVEELKRFFGDDLALLERDVREAKLREWATAHME